MSDLVEREEALRLLRGARHDAGESGGRTALVAGEAGIGKTSVLRELARGLPAECVWWGGCDALETPNPLAPLFDIAAHVAGPLADCLTQPRATIFHTVLEMLKHAPTPPLLIIEDLHWADDATLDLLKFLARRIESTRTLMVLSFRDDEIGPGHPLRRLIGELGPGTLLRIDLPHLSTGAVETLARAALRSPDGLHSATAGNPFFVAELLRHPAEHVPRTVQDLVLARYARLARPQQEIIRLASIVPGRIERSLVDAVIGPQASDLEACLDSGLLDGEAGTLSFRHDLARVAVEMSISPTVARDLHSKVLTVLAGRAEETPAARLAHHAFRADDQESVRRFAPAAAQEATQRGAHREAAAHWRNALAAGPADAQTHRRWLEAYAVEAQLTDQLVEAIDARQRLGVVLSELGDIPAQAENLSRTALVLVLALRNAEADAASREALTMLEPLPPGTELARAYWVEAQLRMLNRDCAVSAAWSRKAMALALRLGEQEIHTAAQGTLGAALLFIDHAAGVAQLGEALQTALSEGMDWVAANSYSNLGSAMGELFKFADAREWLLQAQAFARQHEIDFFLHYATAWLALCDLYQGRWDAAASNAQQVVRDAGAASTSRLMALVALGKLRTRRGDPQGDAALSEALVLARATGTLQRVGPVCAARAEAAYFRGNLAETTAEVTDALRLAVAHDHPWFAGELSYWLWCAGQPGAAPDACAEPFALQIAGRWQDAAAAWAALDCPFEEARALSEGDSEAQRQALKMFDALGARAAAEDVRRKLVNSGVRGIPRGLRASTRESAYSLTLREREVLGLICEGRRNAEIAQLLSRSVRTIDHHIAALLAKLGVSTRAAAVELARRENLLAEK